MKLAKAKSITVILPTYNEAGNIVRLIKAIKSRTKESGWQIHIHLIDDNSPDRTGYLARKQFINDQYIKVTIRTNQKGLATALLHGIKSAKTKFILLMDADFNHHPKYIPKMLKLVEENKDLVVSGSRYISGGGMDEKERFIGSQLINDAIKLILGMPVTDYLAGYILIQREKLIKLPLEWIFRGFGEWALRLHYLLYRCDIVIREIPVFFPARTRGKTKINITSYFLALLKTLIEIRLMAPRLSRYKISE
jgi:dolichol-phosphate mannosyltransferase